MFKSRLEPNKTMKKFFSLAVCLLSVFALSLPSLRAANGTWLNNGTTSGNWSETTNWVGGTVPGSTSCSTDDSVAVFDTAVGTYGTTGSPILIDSATQNLRTLFFADAAGNYTIGTTGGNAIHFSGSEQWSKNHIVMNGTLTANTTITINAPLVITTISGYAAIANYGPASSKMVIGGGISGGGSSTWLRLTGVNNTVNTITGVISDGAGPLRVEKAGSSTTWELLGTNTYNGSTTIGGGTLRINSAASLGNGSVTNNITMSSGSVVSMGGDIDLGVNRTVTLANSGGFGAIAGNLTVSGAITGTGTGSLGIGGTGANGNVTLSGAISGASLSLSKGNDSGTLVLSGANSYGGNTTIVNGMIKITAANNLGNGNVGNDIFMSGGILHTTGTFDLGANRTIRTGGYTRVLSDSGTLTLSGGVTGSANFFELQGAGDFIVSGAIANLGNFTKSGTGIVRLTTANTYGGKTNITAGILRLDHANALPGGIGATGGTSNLTVTGGAIIGLGAGDFSRAIGSGADQILMTNGGFAAYGAGRQVNLGGAGATLTWGIGGFTANGTALVLGADDADGTLTWVNPISFGASGAWERTILVNNGSAAVDAIITGALQGGGTNYLTKTGAGTLVLAASNTYAGKTQVTAGTLLVNGSLAATSAVTVGTGATLGGNGVINGAVTVQAGGALAPGNSPGLLTVGSLTLEADSLTSFEINGTGRGTTFDAVDILTGGALQFGGNFSMAFGGALSNGTLDLFSFDTVSTGNFTSVTSTGTYAGTWSKSGDDWSLTSGGKTLTFSELTGDLGVIPEPAAWTLLVLAAALGLRRNPRQQS